MSLHCLPPGLMLLTSLELIVACHANQAASHLRILVGRSLPYFLLLAGGLKQDWESKLAVLTLLSRRRQPSAVGCWHIDMPKPTASSGGMMRIFALP